MLAKNFTNYELLKIHLLCFDSPKRAHQIISLFQSYSEFDSQFFTFLQTYVHQESYRKNYQKRFKTLSQQANSIINNPTTPFITCQDPLYPPLLLEITHYPIILFYQGNINLITSPQISVVGSRKHSDYGTTAITTILPDLLPYFNITSGLANGIDTVAHQLALDHNHATIAVIGNGIDIVYPSKNKLLYQKISQQGLLVSEFPPGTPGLPYHFPQRNRIVSGLSKGTLVVEAQHKSGALITAHMALEQNRDVFAIPGPITSETSDGCHQLIQDGAKLVYCSNDILSEYHLKARAKTKTKTTSSSTKPSLSNNESQLLDILTTSPQPIDQLANQTQLPIQTILQTLTLLKLKKLVVQHTGQLYTIQ